MAVIQESTYHEDTVKKRPLTVDDAMFLAKLQKELNTQDTMGNADPRFWVIVQCRETPTDEDHSDYVVAVDEDGDTVARNLQQLVRWIEDNNLEGARSCVHYHGGATATLDDGREISGSSLIKLVDNLNDAGIDGVTWQYVAAEKSHVVQDTLFLTHADCQEHLEQYSYNYQYDAHAYAMTAIRSPRFERLIKLLQEIDWSALDIDLKSSVDDKESKG